MIETLKRDLNKTYLILENEDCEYQESYEIEMIVKNEPKALLHLHARRIDGALQLYYDISSKQTLESCALREKLNAETIYALFEAIDELKKEIQDYLLDIESVFLDLEHIYTKDGAFYFCYCPWEKREILGSFRSMLEDVLGKLDYHDTEGVELAYHLYQSACRGNFHLSEILEEHKKEKLSQKEEITEYEPYLEVQEERWKEPLSREEPKMASEPEKEKKPSFLYRIVKFFLKKENGEPEEEKPVRDISDDFPEFGRSYEKKIFQTPAEEHPTEMFEPVVGDTMLLSQMPAGEWKLRPLVPGYGEFCITQESFLVGKRRDSVDGYIGRDTISRIHSRLMVRQGRLYIADANSTNGTFVNGTAIEPGKDVEIFEGDRILFADVGYECYNSL